jgi:hypothetical protein
MEQFTSYDQTHTSVISIIKQNIKNAFCCSTNTQIRDHTKTTSERRSGLLLAKLNQSYR